MGASRSRARERCEAKIKYVEKIYFHSSLFTRWAFTDWLTAWRHSNDFGLAQSGWSALAHRSRLILKDFFFFRGYNLYVKCKMCGRDVIRLEFVGKAIKNGKMCCSLADTVDLHKFAHFGIVAWSGWPALRAHSESPRGLLLKFKVL